MLRAVSRDTWSWQSRGDLWEPPAGHGPLPLHHGQKVEPIKAAEREGAQWDGILKTFLLTGLGLSASRFCSQRFGGAGASRGCPGGAAQVCCTDILLNHHPWWLGKESKQKKKKRKALGMQLARRWTASVLLSGVHAAPPQRAVLTSSYPRLTVPCV